MHYFLRLFSLLLLLSGLSYSPLLQSSFYSETNLVLIGDSGKNNEGQLKVSRAMKDLCDRETCDMGILAGDNVYPKGVSSTHDTILEEVFDKYYNPLKIPFLVALGNHDYGGFFLNKNRANYQLLHSVRNPNFHIPHYWYIHEVPHAVFAIIDTTRLMWKKDVAIQAALVEEARKRALSRNKWLMVIGHHPYLSNGPHGNAGRYERAPFPFFLNGKHVKRFIDANVCGKAHFYLAGHDHSLQVIDGNVAGCNTNLIVSGAAATATKLKKRNTVKFDSLELGFFHLSVSRDEVRVRAFNDETSLLYEEVYSKEKVDLALNLR